LPRYKGRMIMLEKWLKKKKIIYAFGGFLALMLMCYLISRGIYAGSLPRVDTQMPRVMALAHTVNASGNVSQGSEEALLVPAGIPVQQVAVRVGDQVEVGDLLFTLDLDSLEEYIQEKTLEISRLELQISALVEQGEQASFQRQETLERAQEDFQDTKETADRILQRAQEDATVARNDLTEHQNSRVQITGQEERDRQQVAYDSWSAQVKQSQSSYEEMQEKEAFLIKEIAVLEQEIAAIKNKIQEMGGHTVSGNKADSPKEQLTANLLEKETELVEKQAEWKVVKSAMEKNLKMLETLRDNPVTKPDFSDEDEALKAWEAINKSLVKLVQSADRGVEDAMDSGEEAIKNANRNLEDAKEPVGQDYTLESARLELAYQKKQLEKYQQLKEAGGQITARQAGIITQINVATGGLTSLQAAVIFAVKDSPYVFEAVLTKEQKQYVNQGEKVTITLADGRILQAKVDYLNETAQGDGSYQAVIKLEQGIGNLGQSGTLKTTFQTEQFGCCIPLDALHSDANQRNFVYVLTETEGFLGVELSAKMMYVTVLDKNDSYAAIETGVLDAETRLITYATKEFKDGTIVRMR